MFYVVTVICKFPKMKSKASSVVLFLVLCVPYTNSFSGSGQLETQSVFYGLALTASRSEGRVTQCKLQLSEIQAGVLNNTRWAVKCKFIAYGIFLLFQYRLGDRPSFRIITWLEIPITTRSIVTQIRVANSIIYLSK